MLQREPPVERRPPLGLEGVAAVDRLVLNSSRSGAKDEENV